MPLISDGIIIALIGCASAVCGGVVTLVSATFKAHADRAEREAERSKRDAEYAEHKLDRAERATSILLEQQQAQIDQLNTRLTQQWATIEKLQEEAEINGSVRVALREVLIAFPDPPGPPSISPIAAAAVQWEHPSQ